MITPVKLFSPDIGQIADFSKISSGEIFNQSIAPKFADTPMETPAPVENLYTPPASDPFIRPPAAASTQQGSVGVVAQPQTQTNYDAPISEKQKSVTGDLDLKLSNYGYNSDSSPDYNSNVLRVGHADNKLESGVSAALTKSLATKFGLKTGQMFEATTSTGEVLRRRYDDTVPSTYKGKPLPETIDLYNLNGNNYFGGKITSLRAL